MEDRLCAGQQVSWNCCWKAEKVGRQTATVFSKAVFNCNFAIVNVLANGFVTYTSKGLKESSFFKQVKWN
jgi:hypothetical protein